MSEKFQKHRKGMSPFYILKYYKYEIKWAWQRVVKGHDDRDWYSIRDWFTDELEVLLFEMKENLHSYCPNMTYEEWRGVLDHFYTIVKEFNELKNEKYLLWESEAERIKYSQDYNRLKGEIMEMFKLYFDDLWD